jgi:threonine/homoserine/homoserine lactone efflux protein
LSDITNPEVLVFYQAVLPQFLPALARPAIRRALDATTGTPNSGTAAQAGRGSDRRISLPRTCSG